MEKGARCIAVMALIISYISEHIERKERGNKYCIVYPHEEKKKTLGCACFIVCVAHPLHFLNAQRHGHIWSDAIGLSRTR